jgi:hypothetical protein
MTVSSLEKALNQPRPFTLFLTDGRKIAISHPEFLWLVQPHKSELVISHGKRGGTELLRVNQIVSIRWPGKQAA